MTVAQLKKAIENLPDNMDVFVGERETDFLYGLVDKIEVKEINFYESPDEDKPLASDRVLILSE